MGGEKWHRIRSSWSKGSRGEQRQGIKAFWYFVTWPMSASSSKTSWLRVIAVLLAQCMPLLPLEIWKVAYRENVFIGSHQLIPRQGGSRSDTFCFAGSCISFLLLRSAWRAPTSGTADGCSSPTWSQFCPDPFQSGSIKTFIRLIDLAPGGIHFQCCYVCTLNVSRRWSLLGGRKQTPDVAHWSVTGIFLQDSSWEKFFACQPPWASPPHILQLTQCTLEGLQVLLIKLLSPLTLKKKPKNNNKKTSTPPKNSIHCLF